MTTSRVLEIISPKKTLYLFSGAPEIAAADIGNKMISAMQDNNATTAVIQFGASLQHEEAVKTFVILMSFFAIVALVVSCKIPESLLFSLAFCITNQMLINSARTLHEPKNACEKWLQERLGEEKVMQIKKLVYDARGSLRGFDRDPVRMFQLNALLERESQISDNKLKI
jgi:hypothetical protein